MHIRMQFDEEDLKVSMTENLLPPFHGVIAKVAGACQCQCSDKTRPKRSANQQASSLTNQTSKFEM